MCFIFECYIYLIKLNSKFLGFFSMHSKIKRILEIKIPTRELITSSGIFAAASHNDFVAECEKMTGARVRVKTSLAVLEEE